MSTLKQNQSTFDYTTQKNGDVRAVIEFCLLNGFSLTQDLSAGAEVIDVESSDYTQDNVINYFESKNIELATGSPITETLQLGIGTMIIGSSFDVS